MSESTSPAPLFTPESGIYTNAQISVVEPPVAKRRSPSTLNRAQERELCFAGQIVTAAKKSAYATVLAAREISAEFVNTLELDIAAASAKSRNAANCTVAKRTATANEGAAERVLLRSLRTIQAAARQKFLPAQPERLADYYIGQRINENRAMLESFSQNIIAKAAEDSLPGITSAFLTSVTTQRADYLASHTAQVTELARGKQERQERDAQILSIRERRWRIQRAADAAWPPKEPTSAGPRTEFGLRPNAPFVF